jgi:hypothetical protein
MVQYIAWAVFSPIISTSRSRHSSETGSRGAGDIIRRDGVRRSRGGVLLAFLLHARHGFKS